MILPGRAVFFAFRSQIPAAADASAPARSLQADQWDRKQRRMTHGTAARVGYRAGHIQTPVRGAGAGIVPEWARVQCAVETVAITKSKIPNSGYRIRDG